MNPRTWSAETPHLHHLRLELSRGGEVLHRRTERFGFRTVEVRREEGLFVNGRRVLLKGVNRHSFLPRTGRTLSIDANRRDVQLMKAMNLNAVRMSHYPPDESFLEACDEMGLYVLDEIGGWHDAYGTAVGRKIVRETVERDVNHPSVLFWNNGNEGGWNSVLDAVFEVYDVQQRPVLRPDAVASGINTKHYLTWNELRGLLADWPAYKRWIFGTPPLVMPTELLHGLYDGGSGASLGEYWNALRKSPRGAGAFLWAFTDEAVVRTDRDGALDTDGNHAPDGVLGPHRELSGSYYAVRHVFSPVVLPEGPLEYPFDGVVQVGNRYDMTDLRAIRFRWSWVSLPGLGDPDPALLELEGGELEGPSAAPGETGRLRIPPPPNTADALRLAAFDADGHKVQSRVLPRWGRRHFAARYVERGEGRVAATAEGARLSLQAGAVRAVIDLRTGSLESLEQGGERLALAGPSALSEKESAAGPATVRHWAESSGYVVEARREEELALVRWMLYPSGWLRLTYQLRLAGRRDFFGIGFDLPDGDLRSFEWLGHGPARVWKNRREGGVLGVWRKALGVDSGARWAHEPKPAGFYGGVYWARWTTPAGQLRMVLADDLDVGVLKPEFPDDAQGARAEVPDAELAVLHGIPPIGTKFYAADELGPQGRPHEVDGIYSGTVWISLGPSP